MTNQISVNQAIKKLELQKNDKELIEKVMKKELAAVIDSLGLLKYFFQSEDSKAIKIECIDTKPYSLVFYYHGEKGYCISAKLSVDIDRKKKTIYLEQFNDEHLYLVKPFAHRTSRDECDRLYRNLGKVLHTLNGALFAKYQIIPVEHRYRFKIPLEE